MTLEIRRATLADIDTVFAVLNGAAEWLAERGISGWKVGQWHWSDNLFWPNAADDAG